MTSNPARAKKTMKPVIRLTDTSRSSNRERSSMGCSILRSTTTKATKLSAAVANRARLIGFVNPISWPEVRPSISVSRATKNSPAPRKSKRWPPFGTA